MSQSYEDLTGGVGRSVNFRAERFTPRALFRREPSQLEIDGRAVEIGNVSATGLCYLAAAEGTVPHVGGLVDYSLRLGDREAARGRGAIVRVQSDVGAKRIGVRFVDRLVRPEALRALATDTAFDEAVARGVTAYSGVPTAYRAACSEAQLFLAHWQGLLDSHERELESGGDADARRAGAEEAVLAVMRGEWARIRERAGAVSDTIGDDHPGYAAARSMTGRLFAPYLERSPFLHRCRTKPRGYPGDFVAMSWMYEGRRQGETLFGRVLDQLGLEEQLARTVPDRRDALMEHLRWCAARSLTEGRPQRILNLGAGPARELHEWLDALEPGPQLRLVLIDQDEQALAFAHDRVAAAALRHGGRVHVTCRHLSFGQLFSEPEQLQALAGCGLVYSAGLFDYLQDSTARMLVSRCFELLEPGGRLLVGNAADLPIVRWVPEYVLDWKMVYRTPDDMRALGAPFAERAHLELGADASGSWHLLTMTCNE